MMSHAPTAQLLTVDQAGQADLDDVMHIMTTAFDPQFGEAWTRSQCSGILPMTGVTLKVARTSDNVPLGFTLFRTVAEEAELLLLAVDPDHRRRGVGRQLLADFVESAGRQGARQVHLEVRENNPAIQLYRAAGFTAVGRRRDYYGGDNGARFDALTFARSI